MRVGLELAGLEQRESAWISVIHFATKQENNDGFVFVG